MNMESFIGLLVLLVFSYVFILCWANPKQAWVRVMHYLVGALWLIIALVTEDSILLLGTVIIAWLVGQNQQKWYYTDRNRHIADGMHALMTGAATEVTLDNFTAKIIDPEEVKKE